MSDGRPASLFRGAFLAHDLERAAKLIVVQADAMLQTAGFSFPSRAVSTVLLIAELGPVTIAEIAEVLDQPHQLVTQRVDLLVAHGLVERPVDPADRRRKPLSLTTAGEAQVETLLALLMEVERVFEGLSDTLGCDLASFSQSLIDQLRDRTLTERLASRKDV
jgi:DNA-binding MarR family transcriptional regulator